MTPASGNGSFIHSFIQPVLFRVYNTKYCVNLRIRGYEYNSVPVLKISRFYVVERHPNKNSSVWYNKCHDGGTHLALCYQCNGGRASYALCWRNK